MSSIFKNIVAVQPGGVNVSQMPNITAVNSPKNTGVSLNNSIDKINKNISESISKGTLKEQKLI